MTFDRYIAIAGLILTVVFAAPATPFLLFMLDRSQARKLLRFKPRDNIVVVTTTAQKKAYKQGGGLVGVKRDLVPEGDVVGLASVISLLSRYFAGSQLTICTSEHVSVRLDRDVVILGSPVSNSLSQRFFDEQEFGAHGRFTVDVPNATVKLGSTPIIEQFEVRPRATGIPERDFFLIATAPGSYERYRTWVIAGLTTYGTSAAAAVLFEELLARRRSNSAQAARRALADELAIVFGICELNHAGVMTDWRIHSTYGSV